VGFVLQGMKPAVAQAVEWWQGAVLITNEQKGKQEIFEEDNEKIYIEVEQTD
jgi:hypothetical protein